MSLIERINADFKKAMLAHDEFTKVTLSSLKSAIKYKEVEQGNRDNGLTDAEIEAVVAKEVKSRNDSITVYEQAGDAERSDKEKRECDILKQYLPKQLSEAELKSLVAEIAQANSFTQQDMGKLIGAVKAKAGSAAEGAVIAKVVKEYFK